MFPTFNSTSFIRLVLATACYVFSFFRFDATIIHSLGSVAGQTSFAVFYSVMIIVLGIGHILFGISRAFFSERPGITRYSRAVYVSTSVFFISAVVCSVSASLPLVVTGAFLGALCLGYMGGAILWTLSAALRGVYFSGRVIGTSLLLETAAVYLYEKTEPSVLGNIVVFLLALLIFVVMLREIWGKAELTDADNNRQTDEKMVNNALVFISIVALMTVFMAILNGLFFKVYSIDKTISLPTYNLAHGVFGFLAGILADFRKNAYLRSVIVVPTLAVSFIPFLLHNTDYYTAFGFLVNSYSGIFCVFYLAPFVDIANKMRFQELWASAGGLARFFVSGIIIIPTMFFIELANSYWIVAINLLMSVIIFKTFSKWEPTPSFISNEQICDDAESLPPVADTFEKFVSDYDLVKSEARALKHIISSEESLKIISKKEHISERTFQRYLTRIYEKTGTKTRAGLVAAYHKKISE